jgi:hypothetical protein
MSTLEFPRETEVARIHGSDSQTVIVAGNEVARHGLLEARHHVY